MLHNKFQASKPSDSEGEDFGIFFMYFYDLNLGPPDAGRSWTLGLSLEQIGTGPLGISHVVLKKKVFEYFLCISMV